jgi:glycosyltransferase involved in cell wall biosynthesis
MITLSIIICTYNREVLLKTCLDALIAQFPEFSQATEVIVVDNNCADGTAEMVKRLGTKLPWLKYVKEEKQGLSNARNCGAGVARGKYLCYLDDDGKPGEKYLMWVHHVIKKRDPDIAGGPVFPYYTSKKPRWFRDEFEIRKHHHKSGFSKTCSESGGNFIIKANLLKSLGYFSPKLGMIGDKTRLGEEKAILLNYRKTVPVESQRVFYSQECFIYHHVPDYKMKLSYMWKRSFFAGRSVVEIKKDGFGKVPECLGAVGKLLVNDVIPMVFLKRENDTLIQATNRLLVNIGKISCHVTNIFWKKT